MQVRCDGLVNATDSHELVLWGRWESWFDGWLEYGYWVSLRIEDVVFQKLRKESSGRVRAS